MNLWLAAAAAMAALAVLAAANPGWNMDNDDEDAKEQKKPEVNNGVQDGVIVLSFPLT